MIFKNLLSVRNYIHVKVTSDRWSNCILFLKLAFTFLILDTVKHQISDTLSPFRHFLAHQKLLAELFQGLKTCMKVGTSDLNHKKNWF
jgi:hypothetical protein